MSTTSSPNLETPNLLTTTIDPYKKLRLVTPEQLDAFVRHIATVVNNEQMVVRHDSRCTPEVPCEMCQAGRNIRATDFWRAAIDNGFLMLVEGVAGHDPLSALNEFARQIMTIGIIIGANIPTLCETPIDPKQVN